MLGRHQHLALHQTASGILRKGKRLLDHGTITVRQRIKDRLLLIIPQVFDQVDHIIAVKIAHAIGQNGGLENANHLFAD